MGGGVVKRIVLSFLQQNVAKKKIHHTRAKRMIDNPVIEVDLPNKNSSL